MISRNWWAKFYNKCPGYPNDENRNRDELVLE